MDVGSELLRAVLRADRRLRRPAEPGQPEQRLHAGSLPLRAPAEPDPARSGPEQGERAGLGHGLRHGLLRQGAAGVGHQRGRRRRQRGLPQAPVITIIIAIIIIIIIIRIITIISVSCAYTCTKTFSLSDNSEKNLRRPLAQAPV